MNEMLTEAGLAKLIEEYERQRKQHERAIAQCEGCILALNALRDHVYPPLKIESVEPLPT